MTYRPIEPTKCKQCEYCNGGLFTVCPICSAPVTHVILPELPEPIYDYPHDGMLPAPEVIEG